MDMCLYEFPRTAIANDHKPVAYNNRNFILSELWRPESEIKV